MPGGRFDIEVTGTKAESKPSPSQTEWVCDGKGKTRSSVNVAVLVPPHDLMALF